MALKNNYKNTLDLLDALVLEAKNPEAILSIQQLRQLKSHFAYYWSAARLFENGSASVLSKIQTEFAEATIQRVLKIACGEKPFDVLVQNRNSEDMWPGLFVIALGKLGACDLNFSSDVDLVAFYDADLLEVAAGQGKTDLCHRLLMRVTELLSKEVDGEFIWRVDWRLRPNAASPQLTQAVHVAEEFYYFHSQPWHRLAMLKARVIAGDIERGSRFLDDLKPYVWRQNLDYEMIDEIFRLKAKINNEHPGLSKARQKGYAEDISTPNGFNLKLGRGGIREIEFIANALQLLWGGKKRSVRTASTVEALQALSALQLLDHSSANQLIESYNYFRRVEDAVQVLDNRQEHVIPVDENAYKSLLGLLGTTKEELQKTIAKHRQRVAGSFDELLEQKTDAEPSDQLGMQPEWVNSLSDEARAVWDDWQGGFSLYVGKNADIQKLWPLCDQLTKTLCDHRGDRSMALLNLHEFLRSMPNTGQYLRLLAEIPQLAEDVLQPVVDAPFLRGLLRQSPHIIDYLLEPGRLIEAQQDEQLNKSVFAENSRFVMRDSSYEVRLERLRRFVNETLYDFGLAVLRGRWTSRYLSIALNDLAEHTLQLAITITNDFFQIEEAPLAVLAMGKLGMQAMAPMSDLDLIFITEPDADYEFSVTYSRRLQHLMSLKTKEGVAFEMDMRLRPSGGSGPPTLTLASFENYQLNYAKSWEHIALTAGRVVAGSASLSNAISVVRVAALSRSRDRNQFMLDAAKMLSRLHDQRIDVEVSDTLNIKHRVGGLMEADYLSACILLLCTELSAEDYQLPHDQLIAKACAHGCVSFYQPENASRLTEAVQFWRQLQIWSRLLGLESADFSDLPIGFSAVVLKDLGVESINELQNRLEETSIFIRELIIAMRDEFEQNRPQQWRDWVEKPVQWYKQ